MKKYIADFGLQIADFSIADFRMLIADCGLENMNVQH